MTRAKHDGFCSADEDQIPKTENFTENLKNAYS